MREELRSRFPRFRGSGHGEAGGDLFGFLSKINGVPKVSRTGAGEGVEFAFELSHEVEGRKHFSEASKEGGRFVVVLV